MRENRSSVQSESEQLTPGGRGEKIKIELGQSTSEAMRSKVSFLRAFFGEGKTREAEVRMGRRRQKSGWCPETKMNLDNNCSVLRVIFCLHL